MMAGGVFEHNGGDHRDLARGCNLQGRARLGSRGPRMVECVPARTTQARLGMPHSMAQCFLLTRHTSTRQIA